MLLSKFPTDISPNWTKNGQAISDSDNKSLWAICLFSSIMFRSGKPLATHMPYNCWSLAIISYLSILQLFECFVTFL